MQPSKNASRPSVLAVNPLNREASIRRRLRLLNAFLSLDEDAQADLLEAVDTIVHRASASVDNERDEARAIFRRVYELAGW